MVEQAWAVEVDQDTELALAYLYSIVESDGLGQVHGCRVARVGDVEAEEEYDRIREGASFFSMDTVLKIKGELWLLGCNYIC